MNDIVYIYANATVYSGTHEYIDIYSIIYTIIYTIIIYTYTM